MTYVACVVLLLVFTSCTLASQNYKLQTSKTFCTLKLHELVKHVPTQIEEDGCMRNFSTGEGEKLHGPAKEGMKMGSMRTEDQQKSVIEFSLWRAAFADCDAIEEIIQTAQNVPITQQSIFKDSIVLSKLKTKQTGETVMLANLAELGTILECSLVEHENNLKELWGMCQTEVDGFANSIKCCVKDTGRNTILKAEESFSVCFKSAKRLRCLVWKGSNPSSETEACTRTNPCRAHDEHSSLFPSFHQTFNSLYGFPLLFCLTKNLSSGSSACNGFVIILSFDERKESKFPSVLKEFKWSFKVEKVDLTRIQDSCMVVPWKKTTLSVFTAGIRTFNHL